jgi:hypothetical protein
VNDPGWVAQPRPKGDLSPPKEPAGRNSGLDPGDAYLSRRSSKSEGGSASASSGAYTDTYTTNNMNQYTNLSGDTSFTYDGNCNLSGLDGSTYTYDAENRLVGATRQAPNKPGRYSRVLPLPFRSNQ